MTSLVGQTVTHYKILEKLGEGGMGVVYKAEDTSLGRKVALKFLPPNILAGEEQRQRFVHEAQASAALNHPNIATVFEINESEAKTFIALEYIEGVSLNKKLNSGPLKLEEALGIAIQASEGLQAAHDSGIVHRDVKSQNIMVTPRGQVKILDFGLAKLRGASVLTKAGTTLGTMGYMSPEQLRGEPVDHRTDIWSLGVVLYEMIAGRKPFQGDYDDAVAYQTVNQGPEPLTSIRTGVPIELERIVNKTLQRDRAARYQHFDELLVDLRSLQRITDSGESRQQLKRSVRSSKDRAYRYAGITVLCILLIGGVVYLSRFATKETGTSPLPGDKTSPAGDIEQANSIAVLPFKNISSDKEQDYFCDGMTEQIITNLSNLPELKVIARTSVMQFKNTDKSVPEIARQLGVGNVLEGSIRKSGNRIRVTAQLIKADGGFHLWAKDYDRELKDIFGVQDDVAKAIVAALKLNLSEEQNVTIAKRHTENTEAYQLYLKGRYHWNKRTEEGLRKGIVYFQQAIENDPVYALAYAGLADSYGILGYYNLLAPKEAFPKAKAAALKALEIDNALAEGHAALAIVKRDFDWDWVGAEKEFKRAIELNPGYPTTYLWYANLLNGIERREEAIAVMKKAVWLDPLSLVINSDLGRTLYFARRYDQSLEQFKHTLDMDPNFGLAHLWLGQVYEQTGRFTEAIAEFQKGIVLTGGGTYARARLAHAYAIAGDKDSALQLLNELKDISKLKYVSAFDMGAIYAGLGEKDQAFEWLEKAYEERSHWLDFLKVDPTLDQLRSDLRFTTLVKKMDLENSLP